jgi:biotin transport system substrate-specific component
MGDIDVERITITTPPLVEGVSEIKAGSSSNSRTDSALAGDIQHGHIPAEVITLSGKRRRVMMHQEDSGYQMRQRIRQAFGPYDPDIAGDPDSQQILDSRGNQYDLMGEYLVGHRGRNLDESPVQLNVRVKTYLSYSDVVLMRLPLWLRLLVKLVLAGIGSLFIAAGAQMSFYLPFDKDVPVTGQTMMVVLAGAFLGKIFGPLSVGIYLSEGALRAPFFSNQSGGPEVLRGPTCGYLYGFILAAFITGLLCQRGWDRQWRTAFLAMFLGNLSIYVVGLPVLVSFIGLKDTFVNGFVVFIPGDLLKLIIATLILPLGWKLLAFVFNKRHATQPVKPDHHEL